MNTPDAPPAPSVSALATERAVILLLDGKGRTLKRLAFAGSSDRVGLPLREIVLQALQADCRGMMLVHSHPSGDVQPSPADVRVTRTLCRILHPLEIKLVDHVIEAGGRSFSFRDNGLL